MQLSELFDLSLRVYRTLGWRILAASVVPSLFSLAGLGFLFQYVLPGFFTTNQCTKQNGQVVDAGINLLLGIFVACPLILIGISLATTFIAPLVADFMHGLQPDLKAAREAQWKTAPRMLVLSLKESFLALSGVIVGAIFLFLSYYAASLPGLSDNALAGIIAVLGVLAIVGGCMVVLFVISIHAIVAPVCAIEGARVKVAGKRSKELLKSRPYQGSGYEAIWSLYLLMSFLVLIIGVGFASGAKVVGVTNWGGGLGPARDAAGHRRCL